MSLPSIAALRGRAHAFYARPERVFEQVTRERLCAVLSESERNRHARFRFEEDRDIFLLAHALTRSVLGRALGCAPERLDFQASERGRPELSGPSEVLGARLRFNLSHTKGLVACALTVEDDVGIDVEQLERDVEPAVLAPRVFSPSERAGLEALAGSAQRQRFFALWTLKEAYVKATGKGLAGPLQAISFFPDQPDPVPVDFAPAADDQPGAWCFRRCTIDDGRARHTLAVALRAGPSAAVSFQELQAHALTV